MQVRARNQLVVSCCCFGAGPRCKDIGRVAAWVFGRMKIGLMLKRCDAADSHVGMQVCCKSFPKLQVRPLCGSIHIEGTTGKAVDKSSWLDMYAGSKGIVPCRDKVVKWPRVLPFNCWLWELRIGKCCGAQQDKFAIAAPNPIALSRCACADTTQPRDWEEPVHSRLCTHHQTSRHACHLAGHFVGMPPKRVQDGIVMSGLFPSWSVNMG
jgi:hypothetical protein